MSADVYVSMQGSDDPLQMVSLGSHRWVASWSIWRRPVTTCTSCERPSDKTNICALHMTGMGTSPLGITRCRKLVEGQSMCLTVWVRALVLLYSTQYDAGWNNCSDRTRTQE